MEDDARAEAARGLRALLDAVDRGELTAGSLDELEMLLRIEGAAGAFKQSSKE